MKVGRKLTWLFALGIVVWQVSLTGSEKMTLACGFGVNQPCKLANNARRTLYGMAGGAAIGLLMLKGKKA